MPIADITIIAAFFGGIVSFLSPCVLPVVPGYLTVITGLDVTSPTDSASQRWGIARDTGLFILGFGAVFVAMGTTATAFSNVLINNQSLLTRLAGLVMLAMAAYLLGSLVLNAPWLYQERRFHPNLSKFGPFAAPITGIAFGFGWTPCIGPVLTSVLAVAATRDRVWEGGVLLAAYAIGLGVPFLLTGLAFGRLAGALRWVRTHLRGLTFASGVFLAAFGLLLTLDRLTWVTIQLQNGLRRIGLEELIFLG